MTAAAEIYTQLFKLASVSREVQEVKKLAQSGWGMIRHPAVIGTLGALTGAIPAYFMGRSQAQAAMEDERQRTRNLAFGAGIATGLVAPPILRAISKATGLKLVPGDETEWEFASI